MIKKNLLRLSALLCIVSGSLTSFSADPDKEKNEFIDNLMSKMTLEEKIGQLNLHPGEDFVTGNPKSSNLGTLVAEGKTGGTFNIRGIEKVEALQKLAVENTRLGIPLIFGGDVIHGYEMVFPIPLGLAASSNNMKRLILNQWLGFSGLLSIAEQIPIAQRMRIRIQIIGFFL